MPRPHDTSPEPPTRAADTGPARSPANAGHPAYQIRLKGHLGPHWADWFDQMTITLEENGETLLSGAIVDQAGLHGILTRIRDLGLPLVSVMEIDPADSRGEDMRSHKETSQ